jgi:hypothetical protein
MQGVAGSMMFGPAAEKKPPLPLFTFLFHFKKVEQKG